MPIVAEAVPDRVNPTWSYLRCQVSQELSLTRLNTVHDLADEGLLAPKVVKQHGDIDVERLGEGSERKSADAICGHIIDRTIEQLLTTLLGRLANHASSITERTVGPRFAPPRCGNSAPPLLHRAKE